MCLYPTLRPNKKYMINKKNGGNVPVCVDERLKWVPTKCGNCMECRKAISREWRIRMLEEIRENKNGIMVTLTFSNESIKELSELPLIRDLKGYLKDNQIAKTAVRRFLERWRKEHKKSLRHWLVTELGAGKNEHLHLHGIVWTDTIKEKIKNHWKYGHVWFGDYVNEKTVNYTVKYVYKKDEKHPNYKSIILTSAGMGGSYINRKDAKLNKYNEKGTKEYYKTREGHKINMPVYWRNKIYTEKERENLWIEKLDKNIRYVDGIKVDMNKNEKKYWKILKEAQEKSERLGYGNNTKDWDKIKYENSIRELKIKQRINQHTKRLADSLKPSPAKKSHRSVYTKE